MTKRKAKNDPAEIICPTCGKIVEPSTTARTKIYCNKKCGQRARVKRYHESGRGEERARQYRQENKEQIVARQRDWHKKNPDREKNTSWRARGISLTHDEYEAKYHEQDGCCKICDDRHPMGGVTGLHPDHDHATGFVRGLLCKRCNTAIGTLGDSVEGLENVLCYLRKTA